MPIKLTAREYRVIALTVAVAAVSLAIGVKYFWLAFPEAAIEFRVTRDDSGPLAEKFLAGRGQRVEGYRHAGRFDFDGETKVYLERTQGLERMNQLTRGPVRLWRWSHRWFRPMQKEEFRVDVTPAGEVVGFDHEIAEAAPGANLAVGAARELAEKFLREVMKRDFADLEFVETETKARPARTDHLFTWKQKSVNLGDGSLRIEVGMDGDQVAGYREFVKIPEQWARDYQKLRSRNITAQVVDQVFEFLLIAAMLIILFRRVRDRDVPGKMAVGFGLVAAVLLFFGELNNFPLAEFDYQTTDPYGSFMAGYLLRSVFGSLGLGAWVFFLVAGSEPVYRESYPGLVALRRYLTWQGLRTRAFFMANVVGIALTFFFFAYQTIFYLAANKLGAWAPAEIKYSDLLNTRIPWVWVLFIGFLPAVSEEMQFRAFAIPFLKKLSRSGPLAVVLAAFIWGFLHSAYPNQPFFIRGVEVGVGGIVMGLIMLRFGIMATLIWHYSVDALYTAFLLLRSHNHYLMVSGGVTAGIMLVPLVVALLAYLKTGSFADESTLTNASVGVSRAPREAPVAEVESPVVYQPLSARRLGLATLLIAAFAALAFVPAYHFGEGIKLRISRQDALNAADVSLRDRKVDLSGYHRVAWVHENVDGLALRYLLERRTVEDCDRIFRQATRLVLWEVRYFRPLEKEEHLVFIDAEAGKVFNYRRVLDENAPGASLAEEQARALAEKFVAAQGYALAQFELKESHAEKRKAREDFRFTWQAKPGDPRNVGDEHFRLEVDVSGDQVAAFSRSFKLPEEWERQRKATRPIDWVLWGILVVTIVGLVIGAIIVFVRQLRGGKILWRPAMKVGAALTAVLLLTDVNGLSAFDRTYPTSFPLLTYRVIIATFILIQLLLSGLAAVALVGLAASLYPNAWRIFRGTARRLWRRDAAVAVVVSLVAAAGLSRAGTLISNRFHAFAPVGFDIVPDVFDTYLPGFGLLLRGLSSSVFIPAIAALVIYLLRQGMARRTGWLIPGGLLVLGCLGPRTVHWAPEFLLGWAVDFAALAVAAGIVWTFFRDNVLAYVAMAFCMPLIEPLLSLLSQPAAFFRWNGVALALLAAVALGWMFVPAGESE